MRGPGDWKTTRSFCRRVSKAQTWPEPLPNPVASPAAVPGSAAPPPWVEVK